MFFFALRRLLLGLAAGASPAVCIAPHTTVGNGRSWRAEQISWAALSDVLSGTVETNLARTGPSSLSLSIGKRRSFEGLVSVILLKAGQNSATLPPDG